MRLPKLHVQMLLELLKRAEARTKLEASLMQEAEAMLKDDLASFRHMDDQDLPKECKED